MRRSKFRLESLPEPSTDKISPADFDGIGGIARFDFGAVLGQRDDAAIRSGRQIGERQRIVFG